MSNKLYVGNLNYAVTSEELKSFLADGFDVSDCKVIEGKGFAFATFSDASSASAAKEKFNNVEFKGRNLKIDIARERPRDFQRR
jgi:RNA recognition motif-containing protein